MGDNLLADGAALCPDVYSTRGLVGLQMANALDQTVRELGFPRWHEVRDRASVADIFRPPGRCGIYVLSFANGEAYAGQAVDVTRRFVQHHRVHADIERMAFKVVPRDRLNQEERDVIRTLEAAGIRLRNIVFASIPHGPSDFDRVMLPEDQDRWLADPGYSNTNGPRAEDQEIRRRFASRYRQFLRIPKAKDTLSVLRAYVRQGIPAFPRSEMSFWACSCLPHHSNPNVTVFSRINIYRQEVFAAYLDEGQLWFSLHLARSPLEQAFGTSLSRMRQKFRSVEPVDHSYEPGGQDQMELSSPGPNAALELIRDSHVLQAIRLFNLRLMKKGPCMFSRYHCFDLADQFYEPGGNSMLSRLRSVFNRR